MTIRLIDMAMDLGAGRRGVEMGPSALRLAGIKERIEEIGIVVEDDTVPIHIPIREHGEHFDERLRYLPAIAEACEKLARRVELCRNDGATPLVMGGDHSVAIGTVAGLAAYARAASRRLGLVWIDAHSDFNTAETTPSGNIHGMPLAVSVGRGHPDLVGLYGGGAKVDPDRAVLIGVRAVDAAERSTLKGSGVGVFTIADIDRLGMFAVARQAIDHLRSRVDAVHVSFDVDVLDPTIAPGVGTPVPGGLRYRELHLLMETLAQSGLVESLEVVEVNPILDRANQTAEVAVAMVCSLLGKTIL